jgi:hypothetical protein
MFRSMYLQATRWTGSIELGYLRAPIFPNREEVCGLLRLKLKSAWKAHREKSIT